jgi:hypothetical protein
VNKKQLLGVITLVLLTISCSSDDNNTELTTQLEGSLEIRSIEDLEDPAIQQYKIINGNLIINYTDDVEDLSKLENLEKINGGIFIRYNDNLKSLQGLENIMELDFLEIEYNRELTSLSGLTSLTSVSNGVSIVKNSILENLNSLNSLTNIGTQFFLSNNKSLTNLNGLENLEQIPQVIILNNINLITINGLEGITSSDNIGIFSNNSLTDFCSLVVFAQENSQTILFSAGFNSYNPSLNDLVNNNCSN